MRVLPPRSGGEVSDLGAVLDHEEPPPPSRHAIKCSIVAGSSARRRRAPARWWRDNAPVQIRGHPRGRARRGLLEQCAVLLSLMSALQRITDSTRTSSYVPKVPAAEVGSTSFGSCHGSSTIRQEGA